MKKETPKKTPPKRRAPKVRKLREAASRWEERRALSRIQELSRTLMEVVNSYEHVDPGARSPGHVVGDALSDVIYVVARKLRNAVAALKSLPEGEPPDED